MSSFLCTNTQKKERKKNKKTRKSNQTCPYCSYKERTSSAEWNSGIPEAAHNLSLKALCNSSGIKGVLHKGHVLWSYPIQRSKHPRWKMCLQFANRLISSFSSNSVRHTAQLSGGSTSSMNFTTGRISRIRRAETDSSSGIRVEFSGQIMSGSMKSGRPM